MRRKTVFRNRNAAIYILTALAAMITAAHCLPLQTSAQTPDGPVNMVLAAAEEVKREAEPIEREFRRRAQDPEGADAIISSHGKTLTRKDGKWVTPGEKPASDREISIVFVGDIHATSSILDRYVGYVKAMLEYMPIRTLKSFGELDDEKIEKIYPENCTA